MFSKGNKSANRRATPSIIAADCTFSGDVVSDGEVQIDGHLEGDVQCHILVIGEKGSVAGEVNAETVSVHGTVKGQITAQGVLLAKTARILGDITHDSLSVEAGAYVEGRFNRLPSPAEAAEKTTKPLPAGKDDDAGETGGPAKVVLVGN